MVSPTRSQKARAATTIGAIYRGKRNRQKAANRRQKVVDERRHIQKLLYNRQRMEDNRQRRENAVKRQYERIWGHNFQNIPGVNLFLPGPYTLRAKRRPNGTST